MAETGHFKFTIYCTFLRSLFFLSSFFIVYSVWQFYCFGFLYFFSASADLFFLRYVYHMENDHD